jgi:hypothetical protein
VLKRTGPGSFTLSVDTGEDGFALEVDIRFVGRRMVVSIDRDTIVERDPTRLLATVSIAPFLGAVGGKIPLVDAAGEPAGKRDKMPGYDGYLFVPDGPGALIRFRQRDTALSPFERKVYGPDVGTAYQDVEHRFGYAESPPVAMPVWGVAHGREQAGFVAWATDGAEYLSIYASASGTMTWYTYVANRFVVRRPFFRILNQQMEGIEAVPERVDRFSIGLSYEFLAGDDADWAGMARVYRQELLDRGTLRRRTTGGAGMPMRFDVLMGDVSAGLFGPVPVVATRAADLAPMAAAIRDMGVAAGSFCLYGWRKGGRSAQSLEKLAFDPAIGGAVDLLAARDRLDGLGFELSLGQDYATFTDAMASPSRAANTHLNRQFCRLELFPEKPVFETLYRASTRSMTGWLAGQVSGLADLGFRAMTLDGIGAALSSDQSTSHPSTLEEGARRIAEAFAEVRGRLGRVDARTANQYVFPYLDRFTAAPLADSRYHIETDTVPFLQMVLSGSIECYAAYANVTWPSEDDLLQMIDFKTYPSFMLTWKDSHVLEDTSSNDLYSTGFTGQAARIRDVYERASGALRHVLDAAIMDRTVPAPGIAVVAYDNGVVIAVNYTDRPYGMRGATVPARGYRVFGGSP